MRRLLLGVGEHQEAHPVSAVWLQSSLGPGVCSERRGAVPARWRGARRHHRVMEELKDTQEPTSTRPRAQLSLHVRLGEGDSTQLAPPALAGTIPS